jgi:hypothetical protein
MPYTLWANTTIGWMATRSMSIMLGVRYLRGAAGHATLLAVQQLITLCGFHGKTQGARE